MQPPTWMRSKGATPVASRALPVLLLGAVALLSGTVVVGCASTSPDSKPQVVSALPTAASNERAARAEAMSLLRELALPAGAVRAQHEPAGDGGVLAYAVSSPQTRDLVDLHGWWLVATRLPSVLAFIRAHPPGGSQPGGSGSGGGPHIPPNEYVSFSLPPARGVLQSVELTVNAVSLHDGATGVRADAQVVWIVPRRASERIPTGVHAIDITRTRRGQAPSLSVSITDPAQVGKIVAMVDRLPRSQPGSYSCPSEPVNPPVVTFTFRAAAAGAVLAQAREVAFATGTGTPCEPMALSIRGRAEDSLEDGGTVLEKAGRLLGITLTTPRRR